MNISAPFEKVFANANKTIERSTTFINKIKSRQLACANRSKSLPENATLRKEYIKCGKEICELKHGPYYYAYWKDPESMLAIIYQRIKSNGYGNDNYML